MRARGDCCAVRSLSRLERSLIRRGGDKAKLSPGKPADGTEVEADVKSAVECVEWKDKDVELDWADVGVSFVGPRCIDFLTGDVTERFEEAVR